MKLGLTAFVVFWVICTLGYESKEIFNPGMSGVTFVGIGLTWLMTFWAGLVLVQRFWSGFQNGDGEAPKGFITHLIRVAGYCFAAMLLLKFVAVGGHLMMLATPNWVEYSVLILFLGGIVVAVLVTQFLLKGEAAPFLEKGLAFLKQLLRKVLSFGKSTT